MAEKLTACLLEAEEEIERHSGEGGYPETFHKLKVIRDKFFELEEPDFEIDIKNSLLMCDYLIFMFENCMKA